MASITIIRHIAKIHVMTVGEAGVVRPRGILNVTTGGRIRRLGHATLIIIEIGDHRVTNAEITNTRRQTETGTGENQQLRIMPQRLVIGVGIIRKGRRETEIRRRCGRDCAYGHNN
jgi:hypothetical protein